MRSPGRLAVPLGDGAGDQVRDLAAVVVDDVPGSAHHPVVDLGLQFGFARQPPAERGE